MPRFLAALATGTALLALPAAASSALAQVVGVGTDVRVGGQVAGGQAGIDTAPLRTVSDRLAGTVDQVDGTVNRTVDAVSLRLASREDVRAGAQISDDSGNSIGTVQSVEGDIAVVVDGGKLYNIPLSALYKDASGTATGLVTKLSRSEITARAAAGADIRTR